MNKQEIESRIIATSASIEALQQAIEEARRVERAAIEHRVALGAKIASLTENLNSLRKQLDNMNE